jgi:hypothetical protein
MDLDSIDEEDEQPSRISPLPEYTGEISEPHARASTPQEFGRLFPSLNRFSIRHDDFTSDGNMNLRVDTILSGRRRTAVQLFHLRMYNLEKRDFSLRRYSRDSGREVCNSKRLFVEPETPSVVKAADGRPSLQRSVTTAIKTFSSRSGLGRANTAGFPTIQGSRPGTAHSWGDADDEKLSRAISTTSLASSKSGGSFLNKSKPKSKRRMPTNSIKLEFANYARVDVARRHQRYDFEWWGHRYSWKMSPEKSGGCSYLLVRDGDAANPVAYIVPEARSPSQVYADEKAGGWIPPCYMWIADESVLDAVTDVAEYVLSHHKPVLSLSFTNTVQKRHHGNRPHVPRRRLHRRATRDSDNPTHPTAIDVPDISRPKDNDPASTEAQHDRTARQSAALA